MKIAPGARNVSVLVLFVRALRVLVLLSFMYVAVRRKQCETVQIRRVFFSAEAPSQIFLGHCLEPSG